MAQTGLSDKEAAFLAEARRAALGAAPKAATPATPTGARAAAPIAPSAAAPRPEPVPAAPAAAPAALDPAVLLEQARADSVRRRANFRKTWMTIFFSAAIFAVLWAGGNLIRALLR